MIVTYGRKCPKGFLPAASVNTEEEAEELLSRCCERVWITADNRAGYVAPELEHSQTLENLYKFGARLETAYQQMLKERQVNS